jgi:GDPmannose 4,6-dehydratase
MSVAIIFGASGQDGFYLTQLLEQQQVKVIAVSRSKGFVQADTGSYEAVSSLIKANSPDYIFHFAASSVTAHEALFDNYHAIVTATLHILEAVKEFSPGTKVFISGSGLQFVNGGNPINETDPFEASSAYAACRISSAYMARYFRTRGIRVYTGYFFNHDSERRKERHMTRRITEAAKAAAAGQQQPLEIGCIDTVKEYTHASDVAAAVWTLVNQDAVDEAVIGSGIGYSIKDWLEICFGMVNLRWQDFVTLKEGFTPEYVRLVSDPAVILSLGWKPTISITELAKRMMQ